MDTFSAQASVALCDQVAKMFSSSAFTYTNGGTNEDSSEKVSPSMEAADRDVIEVIKGTGESETTGEESEQNTEKAPVLIPSGRFSLDGKILCNVEGCENVMSEQKSYYRRYKICQPHLQATALHVDQELQRFCQQCGRFHPLKEFDGDKKNCRFRLERHNNRRRKSTSDGNRCNARTPAEKKKKEEDLPSSETQVWTTNENEPLHGTRDFWIKHEVGQIVQPIRQQTSHMVSGANHIRLLCLLCLYYSPLRSRLPFPYEFLNTMYEIERSHEADTIKSTLIEHLESRPRDDILSQMLYILKGQ